MDYGSLIPGSFGYTKDALWGEWGRGPILVVLALVQMFTLFLVLLLNSYVVRVLASWRPAPDADDWSRLFVGGWKWKSHSMRANIK